MDLPNLRVWCNRNSPILVEGAGLFLFFIHFCLNRMNPHPNYIAPIFAQCLAAIVKVGYKFFIGAYFQLDIFRIFSRWTSRLRTHRFASFLCTQ